MNCYTYVKCLGNTLYFRGFRDGRRVKERQDYTPVLFHPSQASSAPTDFHALDGTPLQPKFFESIRDARNHIKQYKDVSGFPIYGQTRFEYAFISDQYSAGELEWSPEKIVVAYLDIEVSSSAGFPDPKDAKHPVTAISVKFSNSPTFYVWGLGQYTPPNEHIVYQYCASEQDLLENFLQFWHEAEPDIISGWNVKSFDIPYLYHRLTNLFGEAVANRLSPFNMLLQHDAEFYGKPTVYYDILGIATLDYLELFRKYAPNASQESYKLDHIAHVELNERKLSFDEYETLNQLWEQDHQKFIEYNIKDTALVEQLNAKGQLIEMAMTLAYDNLTNYEDVYSQVRMWEVICYNHLRKKNIVVPPKQHHSKSTSYEGAYVKEPQIGLFEWVVSFDLASLYPHLIMQGNLSPETIRVLPEYTELLSKVSVESLLSESVDTQSLKGVALTPNKQVFSTTKQGFLPEIMETMFRDRNVYKKKMLDARKELEELKKDPRAFPDRQKQLEFTIAKFNNLQISKKLGLNSCYGATGNEHFRFFDIRIAEAITLSGQLAIRWVEKDLNRYLNELLKTSNVDYVIAIDTDSVYLNLGPLVKKVFTTPQPTDKIISFMDTVCSEKLQPVIDTSYQRLSQYTHAYAQKMSMKRESLADKAIWTAKKRYLLNVYDMEGVRYASPQLKIHGLEAIKSSTPSACREKIKTVLKLVFSSNETAAQDFIAQFKEEFYALSARDVAFPRSVNGVTKYGASDKSVNLFDGDTDLLNQKGTPVHVRGALVYNHMLLQDQLELSYQKILEGEKIKFVYLKEPNRFRSHVLSFIQQPPKQWQLEQIIDYDTQFSKSFVEPLNIILKAIGWSAERNVTLEGFFG